jgi:hypothetical protein
MNTASQKNTDTNLEEMIKRCRAEIDSVKGAARVQAYTTWSLLKEGYYSPDELIDLSLRDGFMLDNPLTKIRRGTQIGKDVIIRNGTVIEGERVSIGAATILDNAQIYGSDIRIGQRNLVDGPIRPRAIFCGDDNKIHGIMGNNEGTVTIGNHNMVDGVNIYNPGRQRIVIGDHNELHRGLSLNCVFSQGGIRIGHYNSLGRDGGGVISNAYRFNRKWWGDVLIGSHVETTRGAEILGFSLIGWPLSEQDEKLARHLFVNGPMSEVIAFFARLWEQDFEAYPQNKSVSLFGVVKAKMCCLAENVRVKDGTRIQSSFLENIFTSERCKIYFTVVEYPSLLQVPVQDRAMEHLTITQPLDWAKLPVEEQTDGYRQEDTDFYANQT